MRALFGLILGGMAGVIAGLLMAPKSGDETRRIIKDHFKQEGTSCCCCEPPAEKPE